MIKSILFFKSSLYLIFFPIIKCIVILFFRIRATRLCGAFYNSLSSVKGLDYFCVNTGKELFIVNLKDKVIKSDNKSSIIDEMNNSFLMDSFIYTLKDSLVKIKKAKLVDYEKNVLEIDKAYITNLKLANICRL